MLKEIDGLSDSDPFPIQSSEDIASEVEVLPEKSLDGLDITRRRFAQNSLSDEVIEVAEERRRESGVSFVGVLEDVIVGLSDLNSKFGRHRLSSRSLPRNESVQLVQHSGRSLPCGEKIL